LSLWAGPGRSVFFFQPSGRYFKAAREALDMVGLIRLERRSFNELSVRQRQLAVLARALGRNTAHGRAGFGSGPEKSGFGPSLDNPLDPGRPLERYFYRHQPQHALAAAGQVF
jgi:hypothetical protein